MSQQKRWMSDERIKHNFSYHAPSPDKSDTHEILRENGYKLSLLIQEYCPEGREKSLAITKIEEAIMWANAAVARDTENAPK